MSYYLVAEYNKDYIFKYGSYNLDDVFNYANKNTKLLTNSKILEYHLQGYEFYFEVRDNHFFIYNKPREIVEPIKNAFANYGWEIHDIIMQLEEIEFREIQTFQLENEYREELLKRKEEVLKQFKYYQELYCKLYNVYGINGNKKVDKSDYLFSIINYFQ
jgi:hypothetical protein